LDAKDGFYQVESLMKRVPCWQHSGPHLVEIVTYRYHKVSAVLLSNVSVVKNEALVGLKGVEVIADDILCYGSGEITEEALADQDRNLLNLLKRARSVNMKLKKMKLRLRLDQVTYMDQLFTSEELRPDPMKVEAITSMSWPDSKKAVQRLLG